MIGMFFSASSFNGDISTWDVSRVTNMEDMLGFATSFNADVSNWDVSNVTDMTRTFSWATSFNSDVSKWDVLSVTSMDGMFFHAKSFKQKLCGADWVNSKASKTDMFTGSSGSISRVPCTATATAANNQYSSRQPIRERELIVRTSVSTPSITSNFDRTITCARCGTFRKSGRVSCCAPGGAWFKNCGSKIFGHSWSEGMKACSKFKTNNMYLHD